MDAFNTNQQLQHQLDEAEFRLNCKEEECSKLEEHVNDDGSRLKLLVEKTATCEENATFLNPGYPEEVPEFDNFDGMTYDDTVQDKDYVPNIESQSSSSTESSSAQSTPKKQKTEVRRSRTFF